MRVPRLFRLARRMQRIAEQHKPLQFESGIIRGDVGRDASAHRLAANEQRSVRIGRVSLYRVDGCAITFVQKRPAIRHVPPLLGVEKIERNNLEPEGAEGARTLHHPWMLLTGAGAVPQNQHGADHVALRRINPGCRRNAWAHRDR